MFDAIDFDGPHAGRQSDAEAIEKYGLSWVRLGDAAQTDFAVSCSRQDDIMRLDPSEFFKDRAR